MSIYIDIELLCIIVGKDPDIWKACIALPYFARWSITEEGKRKAIELFQKIDINTDNTIIYRMINRLHRTDGPAIITSNDDNEWYYNGLRHRIDGPAIITSNDNKEWYYNGLRHRIDGAAIERANGNKEWYYNDLRHRTNGPAIITSNGDEYWYYNGLCHRTDGPAIIMSNGDKFWYQNNIMCNITLCVPNNPNISKT